MQRVIFTSQPSSAELCLNEMNKANLKFSFIKWLDGGVGIIETDKSFSEFSKDIKKSKLIFLRHICPVDQIIQINTSETDGLNDNIIKLTIDKILIHVPKDASLSVQIRRSSSAKYDISDLQHDMAEYLKKSDFIINVSQPEYIVSVYIYRDVAYFGMSKTEDNLSSWPGGMRRYAILPETVSRAEFKLLEAIEYLNIDISGGHALDLGAAPGGWSRVLADKGCKVDSVDPADLDESVKNYVNITHYKCLAQEFIIHNKRCYDIIVNDMKMDVLQSAGIIMDFSDYLKSDGIVIMTFKLVKKNRVSVINKGMSALSSRFDCIMAKQLFNNRSEITVALKKK